MKVGRWAWGLAVAAIAATSPAFAQTDWIEVDYGNAAGCSFAVEGIAEADDVKLLTPQAYETYATYCEFASVSPLTNMGHAITAICAHEGEVELTVSLMRVVKSHERADGYDVYDADGLQWGAVDRC
ncbi:hypothetical protein [Pelagibacterium limicola]|uniref:hypothetical protein n=1 Tax=Pelagibacterium limicola TaxID=2791022 RepID=UPI0018AF97EA|nr:hypothetical protein [Pelagibacterium limicola]